MPSVGFGRYIAMSWHWYGKLVWKVLTNIYIVNTCNNLNLLLSLLRLQAEERTAGSSMSHCYTEATLLALEDLHWGL